MFCFVSFCFVYREYPCDHYTSVINVTLLMTGCPRVDVYTTAVQLLQVLDKRFFGNVGPLQNEGDKGKLSPSLSFSLCMCVCDTFPSLSMRVDWFGLVHFAFLSLISFPFKHLSFSFYPRTFYANHHIYILPC